MMPNLFNPAPTFYLLPAWPSALKIPMAIEKFQPAFLRPIEGYACDYLISTSIWLIIIAIHFYSEMRG